MNKHHYREDGNTEYIGINFGSSQTTISLHSGYNKTTPTMIGWAKDFIAQKFVGSQAAIGSEAFDKRLSLNICRPLESGILKSNSKDKTAAGTFLDSILKEAMPSGPSNKKIHIAIGIPPKATDKDKEALVNLINNRADKIAVVSQPFSIAYGLNLLSNSLVIDVGAETIDLCLQYGTFPDEKNQITIEQGSSSIDKLLVSLLKNKYENAFITENIAKRIKESFGFIGEPSEKVVTQIPISGKLENIDITSELREACESIIPQTIEAIKYLLAIVDMDYQRKTRKNILVAGAGGQLKGLTDHIEKILTKEMGDSKVIAVKNPVETSADGVLKLAQELPEEYWNFTKDESPSEAENVLTAVAQ